MVRWFTCFIFALFLTGCAEKQPDLFGVPLPTYTKVSHQQRQEIIQHYDTHIRKHYKTEAKISISALPTTKTTKANTTNKMTKATKPVQPQPTKKPKVVPAKKQLPSPAKKTTTNTTQADTSWLRLTENKDAQNQ